MIAFVKENRHERTILIAIPTVPSCGLLWSGSSIALLGATVDRAGNIYIADTQNIRIRKVNAAGIISTVAGNGGPLFSGDGGPATSAQVALPQGVAVAINNVEVVVYGSALAPGFAGLYQVAIQVPPSLADGDWPVVARIGGAQSPAAMVLSVRR